MMAKTFCDRWTDRTTDGTEIVELHEYANGFYGFGIVPSGQLILTWFKSGKSGNHTLGDLIPIPKPPVVRPWANRAEMFAVCGLTPWFGRRDGTSGKIERVGSIDNDGVWIGHYYRWDALASDWLWYPDYGSDDGKPCVIEVKP